MTSPRAQPSPITLPIILAALLVVAAGMTGLMALLVSSRIASSIHQAFGNLISLAGAFVILYSMFVLVLRNKMGAVIAASITLMALVGINALVTKLIPRDQLSYWAVTIGTSMADSAPIVGRSINLLLRGAPDVGLSGLLRFGFFQFVNHVYLSVFLAVAFWGLRSVWRANLTKTKSSRA